MKLPDNFIYSQSSLQDYVNCPYRFYLRHIQGLQWPALQTDDALLMEEHMLSGARFHRLIQQYFLGLPLERLNNIAEADPNPDLSVWWRNFHQKLSQTISSTRFPEVKLISSITGTRLMAKFDLVSVSSDHLTIYDWKTSQKPTTKTRLKARLQSRVYPYLLAKEYAALAKANEYKPEDISMIYWQANFPDDPQVIEYSQSAFDADKLYLTQLIEEINSKSEQNFIKTGNFKHCKFCNYRSLCEKGIQAGNFSELDPGFEDSDLHEFNIDIDQIDEKSF